MKTPLEQTDLEQALSNVVGPLEGFIWIKQHYEAMLGSVKSLQDFSEADTCISTIGHLSVLQHYVTELRNSLDSFEQRIRLAEYATFSAIEAGE